MCNSKDQGLHQKSPMRVTCYLVAAPQVLSVGLVGAAGGAAAKLSSTELRAREAAFAEGRDNEAGGDW